MESEPSARRRIVVDGSNLATEGRTLPSLAQLNEAIETFLEEHKGFRAEDVTVVVDASFGHRIDPGEVPQFEEAIEHGEMVTPPAGAVGRGDGFILRIAEKSGALVLSNDSFQEFHAERPWLFEPGRLIGGKPVPGVGWVFTPRTPVRGPRSRSVTAQSKREAKAAAAAVPTVEPEPAGAVGDAPAARSAAPRRRRATKAAAPSDAAIPAAPTMDTVDAADAYEEAAAPKSGKVAKAAKKVLKAVKATKATKSTKATPATKPAKATKASAASTAGQAPPASSDGPAPARATKATKATKAAKSAKAPTSVTRATKATASTTRATTSTRAAKATKAAAAAPPAAGDGGAGRGAGSGEALNDSMTFITFVADHPVGSTLEGVVASFTSHGAHIDVGGMLCHVPLRGLGDPPPAKARSVLTKGETRTFELVSLDAARRRAELTLPGIGDGSTS